MFGGARLARLTPLGYKTQLAAPACSNLTRVSSLPHRCSTALELVKQSMASPTELAITLEKYSIHPVRKLYILTRGDNHSLFVIEAS